MTIAKLAQGQTSITVVKIGNCQEKICPAGENSSHSKNLFLQVRKSFLCVKNSQTGISHGYLIIDHTHGVRVHLLLLSVCVCIPGGDVSREDLFVIKCCFCVPVAAASTVHISLVFF